MKNLQALSKFSSQIPNLLPAIFATHRIWADIVSSSTNPIAHNWVSSYIIILDSRLNPQ